MSQLEITWPNMLTSTAKDSFWYHEWTKHGTCVAESMKDMDTELKYFSKVLDIRNGIDLGSMLRKAAIIPSQSQTYQADDILKAFADGFGVENAVKVECVKLNDAFYLHEVRTCMSKELKVITCPSSERFLLIDDKEDFTHRHPEPQTEPCPSGTPIYFRPVKQDETPTDILHKIFEKMAPKPEY